jgi:hypothetical protein
MEPAGSMVRGHGSQVDRHFPADPDWTKKGSEYRCRRAGRACGQRGQAGWANTVKQQAGSRISARTCGKQARPCACGERMRRAQEGSAHTRRQPSGGGGGGSGERRGPCVASACCGAAGAGRAGRARHLARGLRPAAQQGGSSPAARPSSYAACLATAGRAAAPEDAVAGLEVEAGDWGP